MKFSKESQSKIDEVLKHYPVKQAALLPVLWIAQQEFGWISEEVIEWAAQTLDISPAHVYGVVTFYTMYHRQPPGKYHLQLCQTLPCAMRGSEKIIEHLKKRLGIEVGETTPDQRFSLTTVECLASCGTAPALRINEKYYENLTVETVDEILESCR